MEKVTELIFIIDKSGSMSGLEADTIGGFNSMLQKQRQETGICHISTILFSNYSHVLHNRRNIERVEPLTQKDYVAGGGTALLDALGDAIQHTIKVQKLAAEDERASNVVFVIITDGEENASSKYSQRDIKKMISHEQEKYGWEFIFLGANIDAIDTANDYGIRKERASNYVCDSAGVNLNFKCVANAISHLRKKGSISENWDEEIMADFEERGKRL
ncbi:MAG: VWA domain-containing protein [Paludibacteraceae bacterium]|nr:VWA domain-containing protein [Paludibacteraceae bacterium]